MVMRHTNITLLSKFVNPLHLLTLPTYSVQALQDTVYFSENFHPPTLSRFWSALSPHNTPWVFIGGSYPGELALFTGIPIAGIE